MIYQKKTDIGQISWTTHTSFDAYPLVQVDMTLPDGTHLANLRLHVGVQSILSYPAFSVPANDARVREAIKEAVVAACADVNYMNAAWAIMMRSEEAARERDTMVAEDRFYALRSAVRSPILDAVASNA